MRIILAAIFLLFIMQPVSAQVPSKNEMQVKMREAVTELNKQIADLEKQIAEAKKNNEDKSAIKELEDQVAMLKKQVGMIEGAGKSIGGIPDKTFQQAGKVDLIVPGKDLIRINSVWKKDLSDVELASYIITVNAGVEKLIPAIEKTEAVKLYNETKAEYKSVFAIANAATGCWMAGHWEKALCIMGRACMDDNTDADNLNNYASFLIMAGAEHAALPILQYLNYKNPGNSTILNNIGQAWFGLGEMEKAKKYLDTATILSPNHSQANATLSNIYQSRRDTLNAVACLKKSIKENYDPEKEAELTKLGVMLTYDDMPALNYPMQNDPLGLEPFFNSFPEDDISNLDEAEKSYAVTRYKNGLTNLSEQLTQIGEELKQKEKEFSNKMSTDKEYREEVLEMHNTPAHILAGRLLQLRALKMHSSSAAVTQVLLPILRVPDEMDSKMSLNEILTEMGIIYGVYLEELRLLREADSALRYPTNCEERDMRTNAYLAKAAAIRKRMIQLIKEKFVERSPKLREFIKARLYATVDIPFMTSDQIAYILVESFMEYPGRGDQHMNITKDLVAQTAMLSVSQLANQWIYTAGVYIKCSSNSEIRGETAAIDLTNVIGKKLACDFKKSIKVPGYGYKFECNIIVIDPASKIKKRPGITPKGGAKSSRFRSRSSGPVSSGRGGFMFQDSDFFSGQPFRPAAPLDEKNIDLSQFSIEYNKWGNLVGSNFQLNKEGTALADEESADSGIESRWCWVAVASVNNGPLNKLVIKK